MTDTRRVHQGRPQPTPPFAPVTPPRPAPWRRGAPRDAGLLQPGRRGATRRPLSVFHLLFPIPFGLVMLAGVLHAAEPVASTLSPEAVTSELRAAHEARVQRLREHQDWLLEKQRLELLRDTLRREIQRLDQAAHDAGLDADALEREWSGDQDRERRQVALGLAVERLADQTDENLDAVAARVLPGVVPPPEPPSNPQPEARLLAAVRRLEHAERQAASATAGLTAGVFGGKPETVRLLRIGGVAAWWLSLDGTRSGVAAWDAGKVQLHAGSPGDHQAITRAFAILEGGAAPQWVVLPFRSSSSP